MKWLTLIFLLGYIVSAAGQSEFTKVIQIDSSLTSEQTMSKVREWVAKTFASPDDVVKFSEGSKVIGYGSVVYTAPAFNPGKANSGYFLFDFTIETKPSKCRIELSSCRHNKFGVFQKDNPDKNILTQSGWESIVNQGTMDMNMLIASFESHMLSKSDW